MSYCFGIDIGGTTVKCGLFTTEGVLLEKWEIKTRTEENGKAILPDVAETILKKMEEKGIEKTEVTGVGVGVPGPVVKEREVQVAVNLHWGYTMLADDLEKLLDQIPVKVGNDANVAALGEMWKGGGEGTKNLIMATLGTGVGGGIIVDGKIVTGAHGAGGEIGHACVEPEETESCNCGNKGCLEQLASATEIFQQAADCIYGWIVGKYGGLFKQMPQKTSTYHADILAYHVAVNYDPGNRHLNMHVRHMDMEVGGRIWYSEAGLEVSRQEKVILKVCNGYAQPAREHTIQDPGVTFFSYPGYYKTIVDNIGIVNGIECSNRRRILREEMFGNLITALKDSERLFPVVVIVSRETSDGMMDEDWLGQFRVSDFTRTVWRYSHVFTAHESTGKKFLKLAGIDLRQIDDIPRLYIFWPGGDVDDYGPEDVTNCSFGRHLEARGDARTYDIVRGGQAFYHKIVTDLREWNISADMWEGFKLETVTELPK